MTIRFRTITPSKEARNFALLDPRTRRYYTGYRDYTSYQVSKAKVYNLNFLIQELEDLGKQDIIVLLLPQIQWSKSTQSQKSEELIQRREELIQKLKYQEDKAACSDLEFGVKFLVSDGFLPELALGQDLDKEKLSHIGSVFRGSVRERTSKNILKSRGIVKNYVTREPQTIVDEWRRNRTVKNQSESVSDRSVPESVSEPVIEKRTPEYSWKQIEPRLDQPIFHSQIEGIPLLRDFILESFGSEFYDIPIERQGLFEDGELRASNIRLDVTTLKTKTIVDSFAALKELVQLSLRLGFHRGSDPEWGLILRQFKLALELDIRPEGIYFVVGIVKRDANLEFTHYTKQKIYQLVSEWRGKNRETIDAKTYREHEWWNNEIVKSEQPNRETNLIYVCYYPKSKIIKVGRTADWNKRERTYFRNNGNIPETKGVMRLCYHFETPTTGDELVDKFILFCAETKLINLAKDKMELVDGNEYFKGFPVLDFCKLVRGTFEFETISDILQARSEDQLKQFCRKVGRRSQELEERLLELRNKQVKI